MSISVVMLGAKYPLLSDLTVIILSRDVLKVNEEGAIVVDDNMQTSVKGNKCFIYLFVLSCSSQEFSG